jgi:hypothetical protein
MKVDDLESGVPRANGFGKNWPNVMPPLSFRGEDWQLFHNMAGGGSIRLIFVLGRPLDGVTDNGTPALVHRRIGGVT